MRAHTRLQPVWLCREFCSLIHIAVRLPATKSSLCPLLCRHRHHRRHLRCHRRLHLRSFRSCKSSVQFSTSDHTEGGVAQRSASMVMSPGISAVTPSAIGQTLTLPSSSTVRIESILLPYTIGIPTWLPPGDFGSHKSAGEVADTRSG